MSPYTFGDASCNHAVSTGVFQFFENPDLVFGEVIRILRIGGIFVFVTGDREPGEDIRVVVGAEQTGTGAAVTMYRHTSGEVTGLLEKHGFRLADTLEFTVWKDMKRSERFPARAFLAQKHSGGTLRGLI